MSKALIGTVIFLASSPVFATCEISDILIETRCEDGSGTVFFPLNPGDSTQGDGDDDGEGENACRMECDPPSEPLPPPEIYCVDDGLNYYCDVWPRGSGLSYSWTSSPNLALAVSSPTATSVQRISCLQPSIAGQVTVSMFSTGGRSSHQAFLLPCQLTTIVIAPGEVIPLPEPQPEPIPSAE